MIFNRKSFFKMAHRELSQIYNKVRCGTCSHYQYRIMTEYLIINIYNSAEAHRIRDKIETELNKEIVELRKANDELKKKLDISEKKRKLCRDTIESLEEEIKYDCDFRVPEKKKRRIDEYDFSFKSSNDGKIDRDPKYPPGL